MVISDDLEPNMAVEETVVHSDQIDTFKKQILLDNMWKNLIWFEICCKLAVNNSVNKT